MKRVLEELHALTKPKDDIEEFFIIRTLVLSINLFQSGRRWRGRAELVVRPPY